MREYITLADISDGVLTCEQADIDSANQYIEKLATGYTVGLDSITNPISDTLKLIGVCYACIQRALFLVGLDPTTNLEGQRSDDIYNQKYELYRKELDFLIKSLVPFDFTGTVGEGGFGTVPLYRS